MHPFVKFEPIFCKKVNPFSKKVNPFCKMNPLGFCILFVALSQKHTRSPCGYGFVFVFEVGTCPSSADYHRCGGASKTIL